MAKIFEDDYSIKYVIIKTKQETVEEVGRYEATRKAWKMKLETISQYPYALSVQDGIVKAVYKVDAWKSAAEVGVPDRVMFEGKAVDDEEITKKFVGKMIPECYRKKGQASPVLYQKREGEADTEDEVAASAEAEVALTPKDEKQENAEYSLTAEGKAMEAVDLGLSVKWASCNLGASQPFEVGEFYAWGETESKQDYSWDTYKYDGGKECCTKYFPGVDDKNNLDNLDDAARNKLGGKWRMPSLEEFKELKTKCRWQWLESSDQTGYIVNGPNGKSIFLPATGDRRGSSLTDEDEYGLYWSSSLNKSEPFDAWILFFYSDTSSICLGNGYNRCHGRCIRAVCD